MDTEAIAFGFAFTLVVTLVLSMVHQFFARSGRFIVKTPTYATVCLMYNMVCIIQDSAVGNVDEAVGAALALGSVLAVLLFLLLAHLSERRQQKKNASCHSSRSVRGVLPH